MLSILWGTVFVGTTVVAVLDLDPDTPRQDALRAHMLDDIQRIAALRDARETDGLNTLTGLFWVAAFGGVVLVTIPYFSFAPTAVNLSLLGIFGAYTGLVLFLILAFSNPFDGPGQLSPTAFERLLATPIGGAAPMPD